MNSTAKDYNSLAGAIPYGTPMQRATAEAVIRCGSVVAAAEEMQLSPKELIAHLSELERVAARRGWSPASDMTHTTPEGYHVKGVSSYYGKDGELRGQWVKTKSDEEAKLIGLLRAIETIAEPFRGLAKPVKAPTRARPDILNVIPIGDPHVGMFSWAQETGNDFDLTIAERNLVAAADRLVDLAQPADECLIIDLGDFYHADNNLNRTLRSGHALDVDTRWAKVLSVGIRIMRRIIDRALTKHGKVTVIIEIGNHDDHGAVVLALCLAQYYEREPRVVIDTSPAKFHWYRFGDNLIGVTHGDTVKFKDLPGIMATDRAKDWGETRHRFWYCGHVHHESVKEFHGCTVETFRTLAPADAWHRAAGYRSDRDMRLDVLHKKFGRIQRHIVGIDQIGEES